MAGNVIFWLSVLVLYWYAETYFSPCNIFIFARILAFHLLLPSIDGISWSTCDCNPANEEENYLAQFERDVCSKRVSSVSINCLL